MVDFSLFFAKEKRMRYLKLFVVLGALFSAIWFCYRFDSISPFRHWNWKVWMWDMEMWGIALSVIGRVLVHWPETFLWPIAPLALLFSVLIVEGWDTYRTQ